MHSCRKHNFRRAFVAGFIYPATYVKRRKRRQDANGRGGEGGGEFKTRMQKLILYLLPNRPHIPGGGGGGNKDKELRMRTKRVKNGRMHATLAAHV